MLFAKRSRIVGSTDPPLHFRNNSSQCDDTRTLLRFYFAISRDCTHFIEHSFDCTNYCLWNVPTCVREPNIGLCFWLPKSKSSLALKKQKKKIRTHTAISTRLRHVKGRRYRLVYSFASDKRNPNRNDTERAWQVRSAG